MVQRIGIDVGGTNLRLGVVEVVDDQARVLEEMRFQADFSALCKTQAPAFAWQSILNTLANAIASVRESYPAVASIGIGFPGFIEPKTQKIVQSPNLPGLQQVDLSADLSQLIGLPVTTENDALAAAYGEAFQHKLADLIYLGLGTGVGGGLILNGKPYQGVHGVAMEVGHFITHPDGRLCGCGNRGCMEQYASASGVVMTYAELTQQTRTAAQIAALATAGEPEALAAYALAGSTLAQALAHILKVIDVPHVLIGGGMSAGWTHMAPAFYTQLERDLIQVLRGKVQIHLTQMGDQAGIIGSALLNQS